MIRATFTFTSDLVKSGQFEIDFTSKSRRLTRTECLTFKVQDASDIQLSTVGTGHIREYAIWSEQPAALVLRALHLWRMSYFSSIPLSLSSGVVRTMEVTVRHHLHENDAGVELVTLSFIRRPELEGKCAVNQTAPGRAYWPMDIDDYHAVPFAVALKVLSQLQHAQFNLHELPPALRLRSHTDSQGNSYVLREQIPYYVLPALDRFDRQYPLEVSPIEAEHVVSTRRWNNFLTTT
ncbi:hypothetical protein GTP58_20130 [Duganella sp. CY15W]|uniref:hypothetical protein n=1 Tax=Duganella sp. CY15W TaxID=2692172 RepID=UPI00136D5806|nr:hypothetical protein [Duganella sp. CY15W]MYM30644.1 hypothetical protein [Duganella sp. CY15W]